MLGDSLSAAYGMEAKRGWVSLLEGRLAAQGYRYRIVNASISGDTSRGARARLDELLQREQPALAIVELGGNDGLRGIALEELRGNLDHIVQRLRATGSSVLLLPMKLPPNYGPAYTEGFETIYRDLAAQHGARLGAFPLDGIALRAELMQDDGIHPTAAAQPLILDNVWRDLVPLLEAPAPGT